MTVTLVGRRSPRTRRRGRGLGARPRGVSHALGDSAVRRIFSAHAVALVCATMISQVEVISAKDVFGGGNSAYGIVLQRLGRRTLLTAWCSCPCGNASPSSPGSHSAPA